MSIHSALTLGTYSEGAKTLTAGKPRVDGNIDKKYPSIARKSREDITLLKVNEPEIQTIINSVTAKTMGVNINIQVKSQSNKFNEEAETLIEEHKKKGIGELTNTHHFNSSCRTISDFVMSDGGIIIRHHYNTAWAIPYKYEIVGVDMIDISKTKHSYTMNNEENVINGLKRNKWGQVTDVYIFDDTDKRKSSLVSIKNLTYFSETWINIDQQVAISKLTSILSTIDRSAQYGIAELNSAIEEAKAGHYIKSQAYNEYMKVVAEEIGKVMAKGGKNRIQDAKDIITPILRDLANVGLKPQGATPIASEDSIEFNSTKRDGIYNDMNQNSEMKMSSAIGMSDIGVFSKAANANYSSIKYTLETDQRTADIRFDNISQKILDEIISRVIKVGVQIGRITERTAYWKNPNNFNKFRYLVRNKIDTEPAKNANANKINIALGLKTRGQIVEETTGQKYEDFLESKYKEEIKALEYEVKLEKARRNAYEKAGIMLEEEIVENGKEEKK